MVELRASSVQVCGLFSISVASVLYYLVSLRTPRALCLLMGVCLYWEYTLPCVQ